MIYCERNEADKNEYYNLSRIIINLPQSELKKVI